MLGKDIAKEGWIHFVPSLMEKEFDEDDINEMLREAYKNSVKYLGIQNINKNLLKRYNALTDFKTLSNIKTVAILKNVKLEVRAGEFNKSFFVIEDKKGPTMILDITEGFDESLSINNLIALSPKTKITTLYNSNSGIIHPDVKFETINNVTLYKKAQLINVYTNIVVASSYILSIEDKGGPKIYVDIINNKLYTTAKNYELRKDPKGKKIIIFKDDTPIKLKSLSYFIDLNKYN